MSANDFSGWLPPAWWLREAVRPALQSAPSVVASERLDGETGWRMLGSGELIHVWADLSVQSAVVIRQPPARLMPLSGPDPNIDT